LHPASRITLQSFPNLVSLDLEGIGKGIVVDFGNVPLTLNDVRLTGFQGSFEGVDELRIEWLSFYRPVCSEAYVSLCSKAENVDVSVCDNEGDYSSLRLVADQLKRLKFGYFEVDKFITKGRFAFNTLGDVFPLLESLELSNCGVTLSAATFPRLHRLSQHHCDVSFPKGEYVGQYGDVFPDLYSWSMTDCKLLLDSPVPGDEVKDSVGTIRLVANSLFSLTLANVTNLKMLQIDESVFPRLDCLQCHVANDDDFPFPEVEPGFSLFSHLRILSLKKLALDGKEINLSSLTDMKKLEKLEVLDNAFFTLGDERAIQCRWVHFSSSVVEHTNGRTRLPGGMPIPANSPEELVAIANGLVNHLCDHLIIDRHVIRPSPRRAYLSEWYPLTFGIKIKEMERSRNMLRLFTREGFRKPREKRNLPVPAGPAPAEEKLPEEEDVPLDQAGPPPAEGKLPEYDDVPFDDVPQEPPPPYPSGKKLLEEEDVPLTTADGSFFDASDLR